MMDLVGSSSIQFWIQTQLWFWIDFRPYQIYFDSDFDPNKEKDAEFDLNSKPNSIPNTDLHRF